MNLKPKDREELESWIQSWSPCLEITSMIRCSMGRIAVKRLGQIRMKMSGGGASVRGALPDDETAQHIVDWLTADFLDSADWIERVDALGRPLKLMKCGSIERLAHEADKAMRKRLQGCRGALRDGDEETVATLSDGYTVVRLRTLRALDFESDRMEHCVGHGAYDAALKDGDVQILSLRDADGQPQVTMEVSPAFRTLRQICGWRNEAPIATHMRILKPFARDAGWVNADHYWPTVTDVDGNVFDADAIPPGTVFDTIVGVQAGWLPEGVTVLGDLKLRPLRVGERIPDDIQVGGHIIVDSDPQLFPERLRTQVCDPWTAFVYDEYGNLDAAIEAVNAIGGP